MTGHCKRKSRKQMQIEQYLKAVSAPYDDLFSSNETLVDFSVIALNKRNHKWDAWVAFNSVHSNVASDTNILL